MEIYEKLLNIQNKLKAPKNQFNAFGKYKYRNCEDILEALKPLLFENKATVVLTDEVVVIGERYYIKATAKLIDIETAKEISVTAFAREEKEKKGMDSSQVTGASSSYARKYALNGLFEIDDTKDSDTTNTGNKGPTKDYRSLLIAKVKADGKNFNEIAQTYKLNSTTTQERFKEVLEEISNG